MKEKIIVFGIGRYFNYKKEAIQKKYQIIGFIDNSIRPGNHKKSNHDDLFIYSPVDIGKLSLVRILLCSVRFFDMAEQLKQLNVDEDRILLGINEQPDYDNVEICLHEAHYKVLYSDNSFVFINGNDSKRISNENEFKDFIRSLYLGCNKELQMIKNLPYTPISRRFGAEHGKPIDRYCIEKFLEKNKERITGQVAEIGDNTYTKQFGKNYVSNILHVKGWGECSSFNLETGDGVMEDKFDCFICTQTLFCIYNLKTAIKNLYKSLNHGGYALITVPGICYVSSYDAANWGDYWRFNRYSLNKLLCEYFSEENIHVECFGNMKTVIAELYGLATEDLSIEDLDFYDEQFPLVITAVCKKE